MTATRRWEVVGSTSYIRPEILAISATKLKSYLGSNELKPYKLQLQRLARYKQHTLSDAEEKLLAMQSEMSQTAGGGLYMFGAMTDIFFEPN